MAKVPVPDDKSEASPTDDNEIVLVELPFSSFALTAAVPEHLGDTITEGRDPASDDA